MRTSQHPVVMRIEPEIEQTLADFGYELVQLKLGGPPGRQMMTVVMDKPGGLTSQDCSQMARRLSVLLDVLDPIPSRYNLMVSSPGLERPLTRDADFERFAGRKARVRFVGEEAKRRTVEGTLAGLQEGRVLLTGDQGPLEIPLDEIESAHLVYDWDEDEVPPDRAAGSADRQISQTEEG